MILVTVKEGKKERRKKGRREDARGEGRERGREEKKRKKEGKQCKGKRAEEVKRGGKVGKKEEDRKKRNKRRRGKKVLFIEASCWGRGARDPSSCSFMPATPLPLPAPAQLNVDSNASESTRLILYMINCRRHGWPYGTEQASRHSYFCMRSLGPRCFNVQERASIAGPWCLAPDSPLRNLKAPSRS